MLDKVREAEAHKVREAEAPGSSAGANVDGSGG